MNLQAVVQHLRDNVPLFGGRVAGVGDFALAVHDQSWLPAPAAYVVPAEMEAGENQGQGTTLVQDTTDRFDVVVVFDNTADRQGTGPTQLIRPTQLALFAALLNWRPPPVTGDTVRAARGLYSAGGHRPEVFDRARFFYAWSFALDELFTDADGWQEPLTDLTEVDVTASASDTADPIDATIVVSS